MCTSGITGTGQPRTPSGRGSTRRPTSVREGHAQLTDYLAGHRTDFDLPITLRGGETQRRIWKMLAAIPYGDTVTYGELAAALADGTTAQEVGQAVGRNPLSIVVPCHRVVGSNGQLTGYAGGLQAQAAPARTRRARRGQGGEVVLMAPTKWQKRVDSGDWDAIAAEVNDFGGALLPSLLTKAEAEGSELYTDDRLFRATIDMRRYRFGEGEYRYFRGRIPSRSKQLKQALYPRLLPIARDWWTKLGRTAPWPDTLDEWLDMCHKAGQRSRPRSCSSTARATGTRCTEILRGDGVSAAGRDQPERAGRRSHRRRVPARRAAAARPVPWHGDHAAARPRVRVHHGERPVRVNARLVGIPRPARRLGGPVRRAATRSVWCSTMPRET